MNKEIMKVKLISKNVLESLAYYSRFNLHKYYLENYFLNRADFLKILESSSYKVPIV